MGHTFPIADTARKALNPNNIAVRTKRQAEETIGGAPVELATEWLTLSSTDIAGLASLGDAGAKAGFVQIYADGANRTVLAVTFWRPATGTVTTGHKKPLPAHQDTTDDLYFSKEKTAGKPRRKIIHDPRQMDLFTGPNQMGYEHRDPNNPLIILTEEEGDGTTFGG